MWNFTVEKGGSLCRHLLGRSHLGHAQLYWMASTALRGHFQIDLQSLLERRVWWSSRGHQRGIKADGCRQLHKGISMLLSLADFL